MSPERLVIDTNVFISAALNSNGIPRQVIDRIITKKLPIIQSQATYQELVTRIQKKKFDRYIFNVNRKLFLEIVKSQSEFIAVSHRATACSDPDDNMFLELAVSGEAKYIISGDKDLLDLKKYRDIKIVNPTEFLSTLKSD